MAGRNIAASIEGLRGVNEEKAEGEAELWSIPGSTPWRHGICKREGRKTASSRQWHNTRCLIYDTQTRKCISI